MNICVHKRHGHVTLVPGFNEESYDPLTVTSHIILREIGLLMGLTSLLNIWGHIATLPTCCSGTLTYVLPHRNAMPQTHGMT